MNHNYRLWRLSPTRADVSAIVLLWLLTHPVLSSGAFGPARERHILGGLDLSYVAGK